MIINGYYGLTFISIIVRFVHNAFSLILESFYHRLAHKMTTLSQLRNNEINGENTLSAGT